jgi:hypothetical protein
MSTIVEALQRALAAENEAVYGYGVLGPHLVGPDTALAMTCEAAHGALRDATEAVLAARGTHPDAPLADYPAVYPVPDRPAAQRLALRLEGEAAAAWRAAFAAAANAAPVDADARDRSQEALTASALRGMRWRQAAGNTSPTVPFPGF